MSKLPAPYETFAEIMTRLDNWGSQRRWHRSVEVDRLLNRLWDQTVRYVSTGDTVVNRTTGIAKYCGIKRLIAADWYEDAGKELRHEILTYSLNNALVSEGEVQYGPTGRFHRAMTSLAQTVDGYQSPYQIWLNNVPLAMSNYLGIDMEPIVSDYTVYRIDSGPLEINDGGQINVPEGSRLRLYTSAVAITQQFWYKDGTIMDPPKTSDRLNIDPVALSDAGTYFNRYSNTHGTTDSAEFDINIV